MVSIAWIRYEREQSLTAVHLDWHSCKINGKELYVILYDSSRCILAGDEFDAATAENSIIFGSRFCSISTG